ncbi:hypothetical protein AcV7_005659 [Taiwanofungus camphoratus]|nr:hypothetical protein AcV7_005659 [Antrodia cinnamomea]
MCIKWGEVRTISIEALKSVSWLDSLTERVAILSTPRYSFATSSAYIWKRAGHPPIMSIESVLNTSPPCSPPASPDQGCDDLPVPPTTHLVDPATHRAQRRSDRKAAKLLDITVAREDSGMSALPGPKETDEHLEDPFRGPEQVNRRGRTRGARPLWRMRPTSLLDHGSKPSQGSGDDENLALLNRPSEKDARSRKSVFAPFGSLLASLRRRRTATSVETRPRAVLASLVPAANDHSGLIPSAFGAERSVTRSEGTQKSTMDVRDEGTASHCETSAKPDEPGLPTTPKRAHSTAFLETRTSPKSTKSARSIRSTRSKLGRTPSSPGSLRSDISSISRLSLADSIRFKLGRTLNVRMEKRARIRSQMKSLQILGSEAGPSVARAANATWSGNPEDDKYPTVTKNAV